MSRRQRLLNASGLPARTLQQIDLACQVIPPSHGADCRSLQRALGDLRYPSEFRSIVLMGLHERGLIFQAGQDAWRVSAEGSTMLQRLRDAGRTGSPIDTTAARAPCPTEKSQPVVPARTIDRFAGTYDKDECNFLHVRPGALDFRELPSRRGNMLVYRDGRHVPVNHASDTTPTRPRPAQIDLDAVGRKEPAANDAPASAGATRRRAA